MNRFSLSLLLLPLLAACGEGGSTSVPLTTERSLNAQSFEASSLLASSGTNDRLYVGNTGNNSITVYLHSASGNTAPLYVIAGSKTHIKAPGQLSEDAQGNLYVANGANQHASAEPAVLVFAHGSTGNVAPIRELAGAQTGIHNINAMTVDRTTGKMFVAEDGIDGFSALLRFRANANGNIAPEAQIGPDAIASPFQLGFDSTGENLLNAHINPCCGSNSGIETIGKNFATYPYAVYELNVAGIADDPTTKSYLVTNHVGIYRLAEKTVGDGPDGPGVVTLSPAPMSIITSDTCGGQIAVPSGPTPYMYVVHSAQRGCSSDAVYVYANNASGNAKPMRILSGPATKMNQPYGITEGY